MTASLQRKSAIDAPSVLGSATSRVCIAVLVALLGACAASPLASDDARRTLAPTGVLRVGVYAGSPSSIVEAPAGASDAPRGVGYDLGQALASRLGVPFRPVVFANNGLVIAAVRRGDVDVTFTNASPERARELDFSPTFLDVEKSFLVPSGSALATLDDVRRPGLRIGVSAGSSTAGELGPLYPAARLVEVATLQRAREMLRDGELDAFATNKAILFELADRLPASRVLPGHWGLEHFAAGIPKGRERQDAFVADFVAAAVNDGVVDLAVARAGLRGTVATSPPDRR